MIAAIAVLTLKALALVVVYIAVSNAVAHISLTACTK
jgi:hypothetical protein